MTKSALLAALLAFVLGTEARADESIKVERLVFKVTLQDQNTYSIVGYMYYKGSFRNRPLQILLHGGTYDHRYWDLPEIDGQSYSYARFMAQQRYAVLALDLLGAGESDIPNGDFLTLEVMSEAVHQVTLAMRTGLNPLKMPFDPIIGVGHSLGSNFLIHAQAKYAGFDAIIPTGLGHVPHEIPFSEDVINRALSNEYWSLLPKERSDFFYAPEKASPLMISYDNGTFTYKVSRGVFMTAMVHAFDPAWSLVDQVNGPVLVQLGELDVLFPASLGDQEAEHWGDNAPNVTVQSLPGVGHSFNSHYARQDGWDRINAWLWSTFGPRLAVQWSTEPVWTRSQP